MIKKTVKILTIKKDYLNSSDINFVIKQLELINYTVGKLLVQCEEKTLIDVIERSVKQLDVVIFIGGLGSSYSNLIWKAVAKVFHQELIPNNHLLHHRQVKDECTTAYAKCVYSNNGTFPIMYIQGLLLLTDDPILLRPSFSNIVQPFLKNFNSKLLLNKVLVATRQEGDSTIVQNMLPCSDKVQVTFDTLSTCIKFNLKSTSMSALLDYENELMDMWHVVQNVDGTDIPALVYGQLDLHIQKSVECIEECFNRYSPGNVFVSFNGGKDCTVLLHLILGVLRKHYPNYTEKLLCVYIENAYPFPELNKFIQQCRQYYNLEIVKFTQSIKDSLAMVLESRPNMKAVLMGTRRSDPFSEHLQLFHITDSNWPQVMRVSPMLDWHYSQIWDYLLHLKVPYCCLYDAGYTSLGGATNTMPNPFLKVDCGDNDDEVYLPAYKLLDASKERSGRM